MIAVKRVCRIDARRANRNSPRSNEHERAVGAADQQIGRVSIALRQGNLQLREGTGVCNAVVLSCPETDALGGGITDGISGIALARHHRREHSVEIGIFEASSYRLAVLDGNRIGRDADGAKPSVVTVM